MTINAPWHHIQTRGIDRFFAIIKLLSDADDLAIPNTNISLNSIRSCDNSAATNDTIISAHNQLLLITIPLGHSEAITVKGSTD